MNNTGLDLLESEQYLELYDLAPVGCFTLDMTGTILAVNLAGVGLLGIERSQLITRHFGLFVAEKDRLLFEDFLGKVFASQSKEICEVMLSTEKNGPLFVRIKAVAVKSRPECLVIVSDITEYKQMEQLLHKQQEELQIIFDSIPAWIFYKDTENRCVRVNKAFCEVMGMTKEQLEGRSCFDLYPREQAEAYWKDDKEVIASGRSKVNIIEPMAGKRGKLWGQTDKIPCRDAQGNIIGIIGFVIDITARKNAEDALKNVYEDERRISQEREQLVNQLQGALARIRTLDSLLPICAMCKKIRDENGRWHYLETYIGERTDTQFTHGYCPECEGKIMKDIAKE